LFFKLSAQGASPAPIDSYCHFFTFRKNPSSKKIKNILPKKRNQRNLS
jgi:hypothetical protein